ncbi:hypothetical protein C8J56DRAFT_1062539 [Mycena floridula]|nr:hypothetical protein C8J56DRAFT_1062539 [Mycena floridula]
MDADVVKEGKLELSDGKGFPGFAACLPLILDEALENWRHSANPSDTVRKISHQKYGSIRAVSLVQQGDPRQPQQDTFKMLISQPGKDNGQDEKNVAEGTATLMK